MVDREYACMIVSVRRKTIDQWRDMTQRRTPRLAVRTHRQALNFIGKVGFCFLYRAEDPEIPSLWHAVHGVRPGLDEGIADQARASFLWELKATLPAGRDALVAKIVLARPTVISREFIPYFIATSGRSGEKDDFVRAHLRGELSPAARRVMELFRRRSYLSTARIRELLGRASHHSRVSVEALLTELQAHMYIARSADAHTPHATGWAPVHVLFPKEVRRSRTIAPEHARSVILERHFRNRYVSTLAEIRHTFRWSRQEIYQALGDLHRRGIVGSEQSVEGISGNSYIYLGERTIVA
jgi:hypothetical protein